MGEGEKGRRNRRGTLGKNGKRSGWKKMVAGKKKYDDRSYDAGYQLR